MGRPTHVKPVRTGTSRRDFFKRSAGGAAMVVAATPLVPMGGLSAASADRSGTVGNTVFQHGVASGDPLQDRVILWTRVTPRVEATDTATATTQASAERDADEREDDDARRDGKVMVHFVVALDPTFKRLVTRGHFKTGPERDHTVKIDVTGLRPDTTYYYQFRAQGAISAIGRTKTLPKGEAKHLRMAVVSCSNFAYGYFNAYRQIAERADLDMVVHLGDYIYEYGSGQYGDVRPCEPTHEILSLADYRQRHAQYKRDADSQAMHRQHPLIAIWDDHETANNSWKDGAENHQPATEGAWPDRVKAALQAYYEWMPVRITNPANLRRNNRSFAFGNLVDLIMLEERLGARSKQLDGSIPTPLGLAFTQTGPFADPARQMLGTDEEAWLFDKLRNSTAKWKCGYDSKWNTNTDDFSHIHISEHGDNHNECEQLGIHDGHSGEHSIADMECDGSSIANTKCSGYSEQLAGIIRVSDSNSVRHDDWCNDSDRVGDNGEYDTARL